VKISWASAGPPRLLVSTATATPAEGTTRRNAFWPKVVPVWPTTPSPWSIQPSPQAGAWRCGGTTTWCSRIAAYSSVRCERTNVSRSRALIANWEPAGALE
jgi:hypothetical protein